MEILEDVMESQLETAVDLRAHLRSMLLKTNAG